MASKNLKGYAFEYFVREFLSSCGFVSVKEEEPTIFNKPGTGTMIHGLGQCHNADVLMEPPFQIPFYAPSRLLVECKCYTKTIGLSIARGLLGLRNDINNFDIVTPNILESRTKYRKNSAYDYNRYQYQVALASVSELKTTAQEFTCVHRIPVILFTSSLFKDIRNHLFSLESITIDEDQRKKAILFFQNPKGNVKPSFLNSFIDCVKEMSNKINIGILDNGMLLFLIEKRNVTGNENTYSDGYTLHWSDDKDYWRLISENTEYHFELPKKIMNQWIKSDNKHLAAIDLKQSVFRNIILYPNKNKDKQIEFIHISQSFLEQAIYNINN